MNSNGNSVTDINKAKQKASRVAGIMFLFCLIVPSLNWALILAGLIAPGDVIATANNIMANQTQFRIGIAVELIMSVALIILGVSLYTILKQVNRPLALLALLWKAAEAILVAVMVLVSLISLLMLNGTEALNVIAPEQIQGAAGILLQQHTALYSILMLFLGLDMILFFYLFLKSRYIPGILAGLGIFSFAFILIHSLMYILAPGYASMPVNQIVFYGPSCITEIAVGIWLLSKGLDLEPHAAVASEYPDSAPA